MEIREEKIFEDIFIYCYPRLLAHLRSREGLSHHAAEDVASEVMLLMYRKWGDMRSHDRAAMLLFAYRTATNLMRDERKRQMRRPTVISLEQDLTEGMLFEEGIGWEELRDDTDEEDYERYLERVRASLSKTEQELFEAILIEKLSHEEAARRMQTTARAVTMRWHRLKRKIAAILKEGSPPDTGKRREKR